MGECLLSADLNGGGTAGTTEMYCDMVNNTLPPTGKAGEVYKNGLDSAFMDFVNLMVVDACVGSGASAVSATQPGVCGAGGFWMEWFGLACKAG